jgi:hypothetical protein
VTIGIHSKVKPGKLVQAEAIVAGIVDLGSGTFNSLINGAVIADLKDSNSATTGLKLDVTNVPAALCTEEGLAASTATAVCGSTYSVLGLKALKDANGDIWGVEWNCQKFTTPDSPFWLRVACP